MKKLVWSEMRLHGGKRFKGKLASPPSVSGPLQGVPVRPDFEYKGEPLGRPVHPTATYYADTRVVAFRLPSAMRAAPVPLRATASAGAPDAALLRDGRFDQAFILPSAGPDQDSWIQFDFGAAVTIRSLRLGIAWPEGVASAMSKGTILASDDGIAFHPVAELPAPATAANLPVYTLALPETRARYFRLAVRPNAGFSFPGLSRPVSEFRFTELDFSAIARPDRYEAKAGFALLPDYEAVRTAAVDPAAVIDRGEVIDLTNRLRADGHLDWTPPAGEWQVLRFGYSLTGQINRPATNAATGFEVDKLSARDVRDYLERYYGSIIAALDGLSGARGFQDILTDSWEAGQENWTPALIEEFKARRGYDPRPYLPVLADYIVGNAETSDRFLWDFRRTLADLLAESHYKTIGDFASEHGLGYWGEAMGIGLPTMGDGLQDKRYTTVPMGEFWQVDPAQPSDPKQIADIREAVSAAHVYGQNIVAAESFTSFPLPNVPAPYATTPRQLKPIADRFLAQGVNRFSLHAAVHQPLEQAPGFTLSFFGQYFSRHETWAEQAGAWTGYLSRASQLLQEGHAAEDIAYFYGEGAPATVPDNAKTDPQIPAGYAYDFVSRDMILGDFQAGEGGIVAPSGITYKLLVLPAATTRLTLPLLRRLRELVAAGAVLVGPRPVGSPGLADADAEVMQVADDLWGDLDGKLRTVHVFGKGRVYWGMPLADVLAKENLAPDIRLSGEGAANIVAIHRRLDDSEIYFMANQSAAPVRIAADLRATGREAELWHAEDGRIEAASYHQQSGRTVVPLALEPYQSVFIVLRKPSASLEREVPAMVVTPLATLGGGWDVAFTPERGAPPSMHLDGLASWTAQTDPGVRYFSGTGTYTKVIDVDRDWLQAGRRILLDLGEVHELARVFVNGTDTGIAWMPPYRVDVTRAIKPGRNELRIEVANLWPNRIIGDLQPDVAKKYAYSTFNYYAPSLVKLPYTRDTPLLPSGLIGPVQLLTQTD
ncbi:MAG: Alpha-L-arabinofuranosidase precursor [Nevskia sp.]|nr:Alpha-L-arabinofuranosidase precursor [Nevskia sp.]